MNKISIIIPHYKSWYWLPVCIYFFKKFAPSDTHEIIVVDNSPEGDHSIKTLTETPLGDGVKIYPGQRDFPSHGQGYNRAYDQSSGGWILCAETDSFPLEAGWLEPYKKHIHQAHLIGPMVPQSSGSYIHPAGCLYSRELIEAAIRWQKDKEDWLHIPGAAIELGLSDKAYHVLAHAEWLEGQDLNDEREQQMELWEGIGPFQEMRHFDDDSFDTYGQRTAGKMEPDGDKQTYLQIGLEAGQWLYWFARYYGYPIHEAESKLEWIAGLEGRQAAHSVVLNGFMHCWGGTVFGLPNDYDQRAKAHKQTQREHWFSQLPDGLRSEILALKEKYS